jgi:hypothetical protein
MHFELLSTSATQPNTGGAAAALSGDSLTIKNALQSAGCDIIAGWATNQTAGFAQVTFPSGHDTTRGYRAGAAAGVNPFLIPLGLRIPVTPQELLSVTLAGSNTAGDVEQFSMLIRYGNLPGVTMRTMHARDVEARTSKMTTIEASISSTAGPSYGTAEVITSDSNLLLANRDYAVLGASSRTAVNTIWMQSPDWSNVRIGVPGVLRNEVTTQFFKLLSAAQGEALVPIINSGNKESINIGVTTDENAGTFLTTWYLALLK